ncbi:RNA-binding protein [Entomobacter blattae]|uniref:YlxR domain-containing protein n=1 Tax=Entomobacter blattae TaxID=2762277 RepID=A0A7H1NPJ9_9PROT|nr:RNA-binding protein [Entomobacter blattae]QNT77709.1 hypothetical protein JGUZn3_04600 [Entomobacter blattae]
MGLDLTAEKLMSLTQQREKKSERRCIVTKDILPPEQMLRFVISPEGVVVPDFSRKLPGRGFWLNPTREILHTALKQKAFDRVAKRRVVLPENLEEILKKGFLGRILEKIGLARKSGQAVSGFTKVREWVVQGRANLVIQASDGSAAERNRVLSGHSEIKVVAVIPAVEIGKIFGREHAVHAAILKGTLADQLQGEVERYIGLVG